MKLYLYGKKEGLTVTVLPADQEGQVTLLHTDQYGKRSRLLDIEGNGMTWTLYSTPYGMLEYNGHKEEALDIQDGMCLKVHACGSTFYLLCREISAESADQTVFFRMPEGSGVTVGKSSCSLTSQSPFWSTAELRIKNEDGKLTLDAPDSHAGVYCNYTFVEHAALENGDIVDLFGLRLLMLGDMLAVYDYGASICVSPQLQRLDLRRAETESTVCNKHMLPDTEMLYDRSPRPTEQEEEVSIRVDAPPQSQKGEEMPLVFSVGSSAFMSISSVMMAMNTVTNAQAMGTSLRTILPTVLMAGGMFVGSLLMPVLTRKYNDKKTKEREEKRQLKYKEYLDQVDRRIAAAGEQQKKQLLDIYRTPQQLCSDVQQGTDDLWTFMPFHRDFLRLRLGTAKLGPDVNVTYPSEAFTLDDDIMVDAVHELQKKKHLLEGVPLMLSLREKGVLGILGNYSDRMSYLKGLLIQLCTHHSYREMKLVFIYDQSEEKDWEYARWLPHVWSDSGEFRAIGTDRNAMRNISAYIDSMCPLENIRDKAPEQMCVVIVADPYLAEQCAALQERIRHIQNTPMAVISLSGSASDLPKECKAVVLVQKGKPGVLYPNIESVTSPTQFDTDPVPDGEMRQFVWDLFNTRLNDSLSDGKLIDALPFFDMLRCGNAEQINAGERWKSSNPVKSLAAPVGFDKYGSQLMLDIHQNAHGPHGLIAGMTGSGKSEFIITYLLSMAINYSPLEVGFILIDYKGGGMSDTLARLPHTVGIIDNLGGKQGIHRALLSIKSEILRRQKIFKEIGEKKHASNLDIYKYQAMYRSGEVDEPLQHLILVSDEFAELKEQESAFMDDIVSMARIGRSLGVHLILATQKPTGVVSPQIASNARFHVCMKVQDKGDSMEMLGRPEAALLTKTGRFYLQVGFNEVFVLGQSAWSGAKSAPKPRYVEEPDTTFEVLNNLGEAVAKAKPVLRENAGKLEKQVDVIVEYLRKTAAELGVMPKQSWKPMLPEHIVLDDIEKQYPVSYTRFALDPVIGMVDDPQHQEQYPMQLSLTENGNIIVYGFAGAGKQEVVNAVIYSLCMHHTSEELNIYCLDFASEACRMFAAMPPVGDVVVAGEDEKITNLVKMLSNEMDTRRKTLSSFGGSLELFRNENTGDMPNILVVIQNYAAFAEGYDNLEDDMYRLIREGNRFGIYFIITSVSATGIRYRLTQNFKQVLCLQMTDSMDYTNLVGKSDGITPMERVGSGIYLNSDVQLFQTGFIYPEDVQDTYKRVCALSAERARSTSQRKARRVPVLPESVSIRDVCDVPENIRLSAVPVGVDTQTMTPLTYDLHENGFTFILYSLLPEIPYFRMLGEMLSASKDRTVYMFDTEHMQHHPAERQYLLYDNISQVPDVLEKLVYLFLARFKARKAALESNESAPVFPEIVVMIAGVKRLHDQLKNNAHAFDCLDTVLTQGTEALNVHFLLLEECRMVSQMSMRTWYSRVQRHDGLWLGNGIASQTIFQSDLRRESGEVGEQYGYAVRHGRTRLMKLIEGR